jgi:hypothetical protein
MLAAAEQVLNASSISMSMDIHLSLTERGQTTAGKLGKHQLPRKYEFYLNVPVEDKNRPLFQGAGRFLGKYLDRLFYDLDLGFAHYSSGTTSAGHVELDFQLYIRLLGNLDRGIQLIEQTLRWVGATDATTLIDTRWAKTSRIRLLESLGGERQEGMYLQIGTLRTFPWKDGEPFQNAVSPGSCYNLLKHALVAAKAKEFAGRDGWKRYALPAADDDKDEMQFYIKDDTVESTLDHVTMSLHNPSLKAMEFLYELLLKGELVVFPLFLSASPRTVESAIENPNLVKNVTSTSDLARPNIRAIQSAEELLQIFESGPRAWWSGGWANIH